MITVFLLGLGMVLYFAMPGGSTDSTLEPKASP